MTKQAHPLSWITGSTLTALALAIGVVGLSLTFTSTGYADDGRALNQAIPQNAEYSAECGMADSFAPHSSSLFLLP